MSGTKENYSARQLQADLNRVWPEEKYKVWGNIPENSKKTMILKFNGDENDPAYIQVVAVYKKNFEAYEKTIAVNLKPGYIQKGKLFKQCNVGGRKFKRDTLALKMVCVLNEAERYCNLFDIEGIEPIVDEARKKFNKLRV